MARRPNNAGLGSQGRISSSMGGSDPRSRRNAQGLTNEDSLVRRPLALDKRTGALKLEAGKAVANLPTGSSAAQAVDKINELLASLRAAGLLEP